MGTGLVGHDVGRHAAADQLRQYVGSIADQPHRAATPLLLRLGQPRQRVIQRGRHAVAVARFDALRDTGGVHVNTKHGGAVHRRGQRLRAAHAAQSRRHHQPTLQRTTEVPCRHRSECLVGALHDALRPDVDPGAGRHLAVHRESGALEPAELIPIGPATHEVPVGDQHAWCVLVRAEHRHRLAALHQQRLVVGQRLQRAHNRVEGFPGTRGAAGTTVHHEIIRAFGDVGIEIVHQHAERRLLLPSTTLHRTAARRPHFARPTRIRHGTREDRGGRQTTKPSVMASRAPDATTSPSRAMSGAGGRSPVDRAT